jgi:hypothetical protein
MAPTPKPQTPQAGEPTTPPQPPATPPKEQTPPTTPKQEPKPPETTETLADVEKRIDEKLEKIKVAEYNMKLGGTSQMQQQQTEEQKTKTECNQFLEGTGFQI